MRRSGWERSRVRVCCCSREGACRLDRDQRCSRSCSQLPRRGVDPLPLVTRPTANTASAPQPSSTATASDTVPRFVRASSRSLLPLDAGCSVSCLPRLCRGRPSSLCQGLVALWVLIYQPHASPIGLALLAWGTPGVVWPAVPGHAAPTVPSFGVVLPVFCDVVAGAPGERLDRVRWVVARAGGNVDPPRIARFGTSCDISHLLTTEVDGSSPIRVVPYAWLLTAIGAAGVVQVSDAPASLRRSTHFWLV